MMEDDEGYDPNCRKCKSVYGFLELYNENFLAYELYNLLNSAMVQKMKMQDRIWDLYEKEVSEECFLELLNKFQTIDEIVQEFQQARGRK